MHKLFYAPFRQIRFPENIFRINSTYTVKNIMKFNVFLKLHNLNLISWYYIKFNVFVTEKYICVHEI